VKLSKPLRLKDGETIGVIAPSSPVLPLQKEFNQGIKNLKRFGFKVKEGKTIKLQYKNYMAGTDVQRAEDINAMFADTEVKAIICALGGAVAIRTLRYLDYGLIRKNPKIFSGMSDITTLLLAFLAKAGLIGLHQSDICFSFANNAESEETKYETNLFFNITKNARPLGSLPAFTEWKVWRDGKAEGTLFGGNLICLQSLLATPYFPKLNSDTIFFWEHTTQPVEFFDRRLIQLREAGLFDRTKGMLVGKIRSEESDSSGKDGRRINDMTDKIKRVVLEIAEEFDFPVIAGMDFGHYTPNLPLPIGIKATLDTDETRVCLNESYVK